MKNEKLRLICLRKSYLITKALRAVEKKVFVPPFYKALVSVEGNSIGGLRFCAP